MMWVTLNMLILPKIWLNGESEVNKSRISQPAANTQLLLRIHHAYQQYGASLFSALSSKNLSKEPQTITFTLLLYQSVLLTIGRKWQIIRKEFQHVCLTLEISWNDYKCSESHTWDYYGKSCKIMVFLNLSFFPCIKIGNPQYLSKSHT